MSYIKKKTVNESIKIIEELTRKCMDLGGPTCNEIGNLLLSGNYLDVINFNFDYNDIATDDAIYGRQIQGLLQKQDFLDLGCDREAEAVKKFRMSEVKCRETNRRFRIGAPCEKPGVEAIISIAQRKIANILGDVPLISDLDFTFGPGTTTSTNIGDSNALGKLNASLECSTEFEPFAAEFMKEFPLWSLEKEFTNKGNLGIVTNHGKLSFVPKNAKTFRSIMVEPILNSLYQKGVGSYLKKRLLKAGLDLRDQTQNQFLACEGSSCDNLATIDLSSASDNVSYGLVLELLPPIWFAFLEAGRTGSAVYKNAVTKQDEVFYLQKFSSMGNAYTFELESLIFYTLALATTEYLGLSTEKVRSYGDDIICPRGAALLLIDVLNWCGFDVNTDKSYTSGRFRESCGADYLDGIDIRPFYLKERISERTLYLMHNWFVRHCENVLAQCVLSFVREDLMLWGPDGYGDGHLIGDHKLRSNRELKRNGYEGGFFDTYSLKPVVKIKYRPGDWIYPVYSVYVRSGEESPTEPHTIRGTRGYQKLSIYTLATSIFARA